MKCCVYILKCNNGSFYTGITGDLKRRINEHNNGIKSCLQKSKRPVKLVFWEEFETREEAAVREKKIKNRNRQYKKKLIEAFSKLR